MFLRTILMLGTTLATAIALLITAATLNAAHAMGPVIETTSGAGAPAWNNTLAFPDDSFINTPASPALPGWIKFTILLSDPGTVYFQDSNTFPFHYDFATSHLPPFLGMTHEQFDAATLHATSQQAVLGAVLIPPQQASASAPGGQLYECGIQLVRQDAYSTADVIQHFNTVRSAIKSLQPLNVLYMPTFEQQEAAHAAQQELAQAGVIVAGLERWIVTDACYARGWAVGTLKFVDGADIEDAFENGEITPADILLTNAVPAEIPPLAGVITLSPSTPNSHIAILSQTFGSPFVYFAQPRDQQRALDLVGRLVVLEAPHDPFNLCRTRLIDVQNSFTAQLLDEVLALKVPPPLDLSPIESLNAYSANVAPLTPADVEHFGGKASNFGYLRRAIPGNCHVAQAISFDVWHEFFSQTLANGMTLRQQIDAILAPHQAWPPTDIEALADALDDVRDLITDESKTHFTPAAQAAIIAALQDPQYNLLPNWKIRFRSSTNVEDIDQFTGAGLYASNSGCLQDDLDGDSVGPSHCDPTDDDEDGVFRSMRRVLRSFYNVNAYLERIRRNVDEHDVGMAMLVHPSFPDEYELANGVAIYRRGAFSFYDQLTIVTQLGAESVTNPDPDSIPEEVEAYLLGGSEPSLIFRTGSNRVLLGETVMDWTADYEQLADLMRLVADQIELETGRTDLVLDFEFKKTAPGYINLPNEKIWVTQVRHLPQPDTTPTHPPLLISDDEPLCIEQTEFTNAFGNQLLKSVLIAETPSAWLTSEVLATGFIDALNYTYVNECGPQAFDGPVESLPDYSYAFVNGEPRFRWRFEDEVVNPRSYELAISNVSALVSPAISPFRTLADFQMTLTATFDELVPSASALVGESEYTHDHQVLLRRCPAPDDLDDEQLRIIEAMLPAERGIPGATVRITSRFFWFDPPPGGIIIWTAPLAGWIDTTIEGLTSQPIVLQSELAQAYTPGHHNFYEWFVLEPAADPDVPQALLDELRAQDIRFIFATHFPGTPLQDEIKTYRFLGEQCPPQRLGDLDRNGVINLFDLLELLSAWGACTPQPALCIADLNGDEIVNVFDLLTLLANWG